MSYLTCVGQKSREVLRKLQDVDRNKFVKKAIPIVTSTSYLLHSTKFMGPDTFSKYQLNFI